MIQKSGFIGFLLFTALLLFGFGLPKNIERKVTKEVKKTFEVETFEFNEIVVPEKLKDELPIKLTNKNFYLLTNEDVFLGYAFIGQAPSKTARFDYLVVFDFDLKIKQTKVLIYREEYGGEIGSKRWLKQFLGMTGGDRVDHESNIDGIAGATISVRSMTNAMDDLLQTIKILQLKQVL